MCTAGERNAIVLAIALRADLVLIDERAGVAVARARDLAVTGTLGLLDLAARHGILDLAETIARLRQTSFRCRPALLPELIARHRGT